MNTNAIRHIKALMDLNSALFTGLETALFIIEKWDYMPDKKKRDIISKLRLLVENNRACFIDKSTLH